MLCNCKGKGVVHKVNCSSIWYLKAWSFISTNKMITWHPLPIAPKCKLNAANVLMHLQHAVPVLQYLNVFIGYSWMEFPIHTNTFQCHLSAQQQQQSVCGHLRAPGQHQQWAVVVCPGTEDICSGLVSHSPRLSKCDPKVNCPCLLPGITRGHGARSLA